MKDLKSRFDAMLEQLRTRSDVTIHQDERSSVQSYRFAPELPDDLKAFYKVFPACALEYTAPWDNVRFFLRAPFGSGWFDPRTLRHGRGGVMTATRSIGPGELELRNEKGKGTWPAGTQFTILIGTEESGIVWRKDADGHSSYHRFNADGDTRALGDQWAPIFEAIVARGLDAGSWETLADLRKPRPALKEKVAGRVTANVRVLKNRELPWEEFRTLIIGDDLQLCNRATGKDFDFEKTTARERGTAALAALGDLGKLDAARVKKLGSLFTPKRSTRKAVLEGLFAEPREPMSLLELELTAVAAAALPDEVGTLMTLPGVAVDPGLDPATVRRPRRLDPLFPRLRTIESIYSKDGTSARITLLLPTAWAAGIAAPWQGTTTALP